GLSVDAQSRRPLTRLASLRSQVDLSPRAGRGKPAMTLSAFLFQALNGLSTASGLFLVAVGLSLIFGVTRIINIAHGSLYMLGTYIAYSIATKIGGGFGYWGAIVAA